MLAYTGWKLEVNLLTTQGRRFPMTGKTPPAAKYTAKYLAGTLDVEARIV